MTFCILGPKMEIHLSLKFKIFDSIMNLIVEKEIEENKKIKKC